MSDTGLAALGANGLPRVTPFGYAGALTTVTELEPANMSNAPFVTSVRSMRKAGSTTGSSLWPPWSSAAHLLGGSPRPPYTNAPAGTSTVLDSVARHVGIGMWKIC